MKYCIDCNMNLGNIDLVEKGNDTFCPKCETEVIEFTSAKLERLVSDVTNAFYNIKDTNIQNNAQKLIENAKVIETGERKLKKELWKRERSLKEMQYELEVIRNIGEQLNYNFKR